jgi:hypothetical protein
VLNKQTRRLRFGLDKRKGCGCSLPLNLFCLSFDSSRNVNCVTAAALALTGGGFCISQCQTFQSRVIFRTRLDPQFSEGGLTWMKTVLLVEDDAKLARIIRTFLQKQDFCVEIESHGGRAVTRIVADRPDAVVLDINLPGINGFAVCRQVRALCEGAILM